jgi:threonine/homoserine/homoserine lactone efflux protein
VARRRDALTRYRSWKLRATFISAGYLIYLGVRSFISRSHINSVDFSLRADDRSVDQAFRRGFLVNVLNPKAAITFMAFMPQFVHPEKGQVWLQFLMLGLMTSAFAWTWFSSVAITIHFVGTRIRENKVFWWIQERITGCILITLGLRLALERRTSQ